MSIPLTFGRMYDCPMVSAAPVRLLLLLLLWRWISAFSWCRRVTGRHANMHSVHWPVYSTPLCFISPSALPQPAM